MSENNPWEKFDIRDVVFLEQFFAKLDAEGMPQPGQPDPPPVDPPAPPPPDPPAPPPVVNEYTISGVVLAQRPNAGAAYVNGWCAMVDAKGTYQKPMSGETKFVQARWLNDESPDNWMTIQVGPHAGYMDWEPGFWSFTPAQLDGTWEIRALDDVRGIVSPWVRVMLDASHGREADMLFTWQPAAAVTPEPPPEPGSIVQAIRNAAWGKLGIPYNPDAALAKFAREQELGNPVTAEFDIGNYRAQGYAGGIVIAVIDAWDRIEVLAW